MAQLELDELFFNALMADADLVLAVGGRIESTCFEVSPDEQDNTPLPCIIEWESTIDRVQASIEVDAKSPKEVKALIGMVRKAVANYIESLADKDEYVPYLVSVQTNGVAWDWMKPCYHSTITYQCDIENNL